ncbi:hypothetical protein B4U80_14006 [Leptotrombidium deliense]|uniref:C-type lectin domain-containing protein n=1 Tax=Leptotrombidium deliense TaxID=299467 RepID=A0A443S584_9ACAR|nr:hypothetical protein B4U80_14006 [Leptotrombidium deliense]
MSGCSHQSVAKRAVYWECPADWKQWNKKCYGMTKKPLTFDENKNECALMNAQMVSIHSYDENAVIIYNVTNSTRTWIGLVRNDTKFNGLKWVNDDNVNFLKLSDEANASLFLNSNKRCFTMSYLVKNWHQTTCSEKHWGLCQVEFYDYIVDRKIDALKGNVKLLQQTLLNIEFSNQSKLFWYEYIFYMVTTLNSIYVKMRNLLN